MSSGSTDPEKPARAAERPPGQTRRQILDTAAALLRRKGYEGTTTRLIAAAVGIKAGSVYHYFVSKDAIVETVMSEGIDLVRNAVLDALAALPADAPPSTVLRTGIEAHLFASLEHSDYTSASIKNYSYLPLPVRRNVRAHRRAYEDVWRELIERIGRDGALPAISADSLRRFLLGAMNWAGEWYRPDRMDVREIARELAVLAGGSRAG